MDVKKLADTNYISQFYQSDQLVNEIMKVNNLLNILPEYNTQIQLTKWFFFNRNSISSPILVDSQPLTTEYIKIREHDSDIQISQRKLLIQPSLKNSKVTINAKDYTDFFKDRGLSDKYANNSKDSFEELDLIKYQEIILQCNQKTEAFKKFNTPLQNLHLMNTAGKIDALYVIRKSIENELIQQLDPDLKHHVENDTIPELQKIFIKRLELLYEVLAQKL
jgi:hypothetical protein